MNKIKLVNEMKYEGNMGELVGPKLLSCVHDQLSKPHMPTNARDPVSRVARVARAVERALGVGAVGVWVAIMVVVIMSSGERFDGTLVNIWGI